MQYFDTYNLRARLFPAVIAIAPAIALAAIAISWDELNLPQVIATAAIGVLFVAAADIARRTGKRFERKMFASTGGRPVMTLLRLSDATLDKKTKDRYRGYLAAQLSEKAPTAQAEARDPKAADGFYGRCGAWLRERTRDKAKFKILFEENVTYGFRRNLYGLRSPGLALNAIVVLACLYLLSPYDGWFSGTTRPKIIAVLTIAALHAVYFFFFVTRRSVEEASDQYARQLVLSCEGMMEPS
jgi:multisubunit Na+/H+ antiporter MnhB subunit